MGTQTLKDSHYHTLGYIETKNDGTQVAKDSHYHTLGYYDPKSDQTKDSHYHVIGHGNLLASLIHEKS
jgi:hypothetical protein